MKEVYVFADHSLYHFRINEFSPAFGLTSLVLERAGIHYVLGEEDICLNGYSLILLKKEVETELETLIVNWIQSKVRGVYELWVHGRKLELDKALPLGQTIIFLSELELLVQQCVKLKHELKIYNVSGLGELEVAILIELRREKSGVEMEKLERDLAMRISYDKEQLNDSLEKLLESNYVDIENKRVVPKRKFFEIL